MLHPNNCVFTALGNLSGKDAMEIWHLQFSLPLPNTNVEVISKLTNNNPLDGCPTVSFFLISEKMEMPMASESLP